MVTKEEEEEALNSFIGITDSTQTIAKQILQATNWDLQQAVEFYYTSHDIPSPQPDYVPPHAHPPQEEINTSHYYSTTDSEINPPEDDPSAFLSRNNDGIGAANPEEGVRAAIPQELNRIQSPGIQDITNRPDNAMDAFRHISRVLKNHDINQDEAKEGEDMLLQMYKPPFELMTTGPIVQARDQALENGKWVLVNIQDDSFHSLSLNRDTWSDTMLQSIISNYFIFWQEYTETTEGKRFIEFYSISDYPFVGIIDPKTGEIVRSWSNQSFEPKVLQTFLNSFIDENQSNSSTENNNNNNNDDDSKTTTTITETKTEPIDLSSPPEGNNSSSTLETDPEPSYFPYSEYVVTKNDSQPSTRLQFRFTDGSRSVKRMRFDTPLAAVHQIFRDHMNCKSCQVFFVDQELPDKTDETLQDHQVTNAVLSARTI